MSSHVPQTSFSYTRMYAQLVHDIITKTNYRHVTNPCITCNNEIHYVKPDNVALLAGLGHNTPAYTLYTCVHACVIMLVCICMHMCLYACVSVHVCNQRSTIFMKYCRATCLHAKSLFQVASTVALVLRDHCHELPHLFKDHIFVPSVSLKGHRAIVQHMQKGLTVGVKRVVW